MAGNTRDAGLIPGSGRYPGGGNGNPFQYFYLENSMIRGAWGVGGSGDSPKGHKQSDTIEQLTHQAIMVDIAATLPEVFSWNAFNDSLSFLYHSTNSFLIKLYTMDYIFFNLNS